MVMYEVELSNEIHEKQIKNLIDEDKCQIIQKRYGQIVGKCVLYRGEEQIVNNIQYLNVE